MIRRPRILVVGSMAMDFTVTTGVFPGSGETVLGESCAVATGGKGLNQAVQAARLGADVTMLGRLGRDANGDAVLEACRREGVDVSHVARDGACETGCAMILLERKPDGSTQNRILVVPGANMRLTPDDARFLREEMERFDLVMLQLEIPMETNEAVAAIAREKRVRVMLNPAPSAPLPEGLLKCLSYISPNEHEAEDLTGVKIRYGSESDFETDIMAAAEKLRGRGVANALITLGSRGALLFDGRQAFRCPAVKGVTAVDPTAAGDSFVSAFSVGVCCGWSPYDALCAANHTAAVTVTGKGAAPSLPMLAQVEEMLAQRNGPRLDFSMLRR